MDLLIRSRLVTVDVDTLLVDVAKLLSDTQISLAVVCNPKGTMVGIIPKTNIVQRIGQCQGVSYTSAAGLKPIVEGMLSKRGSVQVDARTNTLIVTDIRPATQRIRSVTGSH